jgi:hypothetical protein
MFLVLRIRSIDLTVSGGLVPWDEEGDDQHHGSNQWFGVLDNVREERFEDSLRTLHTWEGRGACRGAAEDHSRDRQVTFGVTRLTYYISKNNGAMHMRVCVTLDFDPGLPLPPWSTSKQPIEVATKARSSDDAAAYVGSSGRNGYDHVIDVSLHNRPVPKSFLVLVRRFPCV